MVIKQNRYEHGGTLNKQVCRSSLLSSRNVRWPRRMLPPDDPR